MTVNLYFCRIVTYKVVERKFMRNEIMSHVAGQMVNFRCDLMIQDSIWDDKVCLIVLLIYSIADNVKVRCTWNDVCSDIDKIRKMNEQSRGENEEDSQLPPDKWLTVIFACIYIHTTDMCIYTYTKLCLALSNSMIFINPLWCSCMDPGCHACTYAPIFIHICM